MILDRHCEISPTAHNSVVVCSGNNSAPPLSGIPPENVFDVAIQLYLISSIGIIGLFGNIISLIVLRQDKERKETLLLLQALAVSDALYLVSALLRYPIGYLMTNPIRYHELQLYAYPLLKTFQTITIWMMLLVTVDRYIYVCKPLKTSELSNPRSRRIFAALVFVFGIIYSLPLYFEKCIITFPSDCSEVTISRVVYRAEFLSVYYYDIYLNGMYIVFLYLGPLTSLCVMNISLIRTIHRSKQRLREFRVKGYKTNVHGSRYASHTENNATLVLIIIILIFIVCETPELIIKILVALDRHFEAIHAISQALYRFNTISALFMVINSSINFFIYFAFGKRFRYIMKETFIYKLQSSMSLFTRESAPNRPLI